MKPSTAKLVAAIEAENSPRLKRILKMAKEGYYHDFDGNLELPTLTLATDFAAYGFPKLAKRVLEGEFSASSEEIQMWHDSLEGMEAFHNDEVVANTRLVAMSMNKAMGIPWDENAWTEFVNSGRLSI